MLKAGDYVVHSMEGVCEVKCIVEMTKGDQAADYYQLTSWPEGRNTVYVPVNQESSRTRIRRVLSKDEVRDIFQEILHAQPEWISDINQRQEVMAAILRDQEPYEMARMCKMLMQKDLEKPLGSRDKSVLLTLQKVLFSEVAMVTNQDFRVILRSIKQSLRNPEEPFVLVD